MVDVFEQVEEELRSERYKRLARTWLPVLGGVLLVALIAALAWWGWQTWQTRQADTASAAYDRGMEALRADNTAEADAAFAEAADAGSTAYRVLALMQQAGIAESAGRSEDAVALFDQAAGATRDRILSDPAALKAAFIVMNTGELADIETRLTPLTAEGRPLRAFAQEALALARIQHGKPAEARDLLVQLQLGQDVPDSIRQRAQAAIASIDNGTAAALPAIVRAQTQAEAQAREAAAVARAAAARANAPAQTPAPAAEEANP